MLLVLCVMLLRDAGRCLQMVHFFLLFLCFFVFCNCEMSMLKVILILSMGGFRIKIECWRVGDCKGGLYHVI